MAGSEIMAMVTTVAPTMPVEAARSAPTTITETASPPRSPPKSRAISSSSSSAIRERSRITPMRTNMGMAISTSLVMMPKTRWATAPMRLKSKAPRARPSPAKSTAIPDSVKITG